ncbi:MAG: sulfite exporter TauE/SafE family protein [Gammaproteobacteria bacterium]|nr:sulfite exporter TauE/SafE family protein [Gammaproteobacteria bacterium]
MDYTIVCLAALIVSALTLFSGFGLGTLLMPVFAIFFPVPIAIAATAAVHLANNLFKIVLVGKRADFGIVLRFGVPAMATAFVGASLLGMFASMPVIASYSIGEAVHDLTAVKLVIGVLIITFALFDLIPRLDEISFDKRYLVLGGALSGFFGGLSGNQGALRSAFLLKTGLSKEVFIGTGVVCAVITDCARLSVYGVAFYHSWSGELDSGIGGLVIAASLAAFLGAFIGSRLIKKITMRVIRLIVGVMMLGLGLGIATGLI